MTNEVIRSVVIESDGRYFWMRKPNCAACGENHGKTRTPTRVSTVHLLANRDAIVVPDK